MKKNNQMKPDNVAKRLWAFFIVLTMCITVQPVVPVKGAGGWADSGKNDLYGI